MSKKKTPSIDLLDYAGIEEELLEEPAAEETQSDILPITDHLSATVTTSANLRNAPEGTIIAILPKGAHVNVPYGFDDVWTRVITDYGMEGYIKTYLLAQNM